MLSSIIPSLTPLESSAGLDCVALLGIGTAVPPFQASQKDVLLFIRSHLLDVSRTTHALYDRTLRHPSIETRHFALSSLDEVLEKNLDRVNERFRRWAVTLSTEALKRASAAAGIERTAIDYLVVATCTGYLCPGISAYVLEAAGLRSDVRCADLVGMGCGAAVPALEQAANFARTHPGSVAAVLSTEICSAAMFSNDDPGVIVSNTIFADGSAAVLLTAPKKNSTSSKSTMDRQRLPRVLRFASVIKPEWRDTLRFTTEQGHLKNILGKEVPEQAAAAVQEICQELTDHGRIPVTRWLVHAAGEKVLQEIEQALQLPERALTSSREILRRYGNMSSPTVLFVLEEEMRSRPPDPGDQGLILSFGAGFSAHGALIEF